ncbi:MAG: BadF/BadG/BcrA/BcrD ATPase family protein [Chloroflexota bacterium]
MQDGDRLVLGVDGGGSKTVALLADGDGKVIGRGTGGGANVRALGMAAAGAAIEAAIDRAFAAAGIARRPCDAICLGLAGAGRPAERALVEAWAAERELAERALVRDDAALVLAAGCPAGWGVAVICGTGSIAVGRAPDGRLARAGGWGYLLGDEGSGRDIALAGLRAACRAADGRGPQTALLPMVLERWGLSRPEELIARAYEGDQRALLEAMPPLVGRAAAEGDGPALAILEAAGVELATAAAAVAARLGLEPPLPLALAGAVLLNIPLLSAGLLAALERRGYPAHPTHVPEPALGAVRLALDTLA